MDVVVYSRPNDESSRRIKEILTDRGVEYREQVCADGKLDRKALLLLDIQVEEAPVTGVDGVPIAGMDRARIEQAIGWVGF